MTAWITRNINITSALNFEDREKNVVVFGNLTSDHDITFKVKNLVVFGEIVTTKDMTLDTTGDLFNVGKLEGRNVKLEHQNIYNGLDDLAIAKIMALGIDLRRAANGNLTVRLPQPNA